MNILILSCGTRNKIIEYFKKNLKKTDKILATDCSHIAPALYVADKYYIVPRVSDSNYLPIIFNICRKEKISCILSLIDSELSLLAKNQQNFNDLGVQVIGSSFDLCELCLNKYAMYQWLKVNNFNTAISYIDRSKFLRDLEKNLITFPVFVKPVQGSASLEISKVMDVETLDLLFKHNNNLMIQEYMEGQEIGADCYIDLISGKVVSIFTKRKLVMRAGETDKAVSFKDKKLFELLEDFIVKCGFKGQIDIDIFKQNDKYYISEVNPRFGGGYPHAYECGCNHMKYIINNVKGIVNKSSIGNYEDDIYMMKYNEAVYRKIIF